MLKKIVSNSAVYGIAPQIPQVANILILPIITQDLTRLDYGVAGIIYSYLAALTAFHLLGIKIVLSTGYYHHKSQYKWLWRQMHGFISLWSLLFSLLVAVIIFMATPEEALENRWLIIFLHVIPSAFFNTTTEIGTVYFQVRQNPKPIAAQVAVVGLISILINLWLISYEKMGYMGWFWSRFIGSTLSFGFYAYLLYNKHKLKPILNFKWRLIKEKLKISLPLIPHRYGSYLLNSSDRIVMDLLRVDVKSIGIYNLAGNFGSYFNSFSDGMGYSINPVLFGFLRNLNKEQAFKKTRDMIFLWQSAMIIFSFLVCLWFKEVFMFLINNETLHDAYSLAIIMIMGYNYRPIYASFAVKCAYYEKTKRIWRVSFAAGIINVVLNIIFIPIYGIEAAAVTTFVSFLYLGVAGFFLSDYRSFNDINYYPILWVILIIALTFLVYMLKDISWQNKLGISLFILLATSIWALSNQEFLKSFNPVKQKQQ